MEFDHETDSTERSHANNGACPFNYLQGHEGWGVSTICATGGTLGGLGGGGGTGLGRSPFERALTSGLFHFRNISRPYKGPTKRKKYQSYHAQDSQMTVLCMCGLTFRKLSNGHSYMCPCSASDTIPSNPTIKWSSVRVPTMSSALFRI